MRPDISVHPNERRIYKSIKETIMRSTEINEKFSKRKIWAGRILTIIGTIFLVFDSLGKILGVQEAVEGTVKLGYPNQLVPIIGIPFAILSVIYGVKSLHKIKHSPERYKGKGFGIAGMVIGILALIFNILLIVSVIISFPLWEVH